MSMVGKAFAEYNSPKGSNWYCEIISIIEGKYWLVRSNRVSKDISIPDKILKLIGTDTLISSHDSSQYTSDDICWFDSWADLERCVIGIWIEDLKEGIDSE